jgi:hypothetical protein
MMRCCAATCVRPPARVGGRVAVTARSLPLPPACTLASSRRHSPGGGAMQCSFCHRRACARGHRAASTIAPVTRVQLAPRTPVLVNNSMPMEVMSSARCGGNNTGFRTGWRWNSGQTPHHAELPVPQLAARFSCVRATAKMLCVLPTHGWRAAHTLSCRVWMSVWRCQSIKYIKLPAAGRVLQ